MSKCFLCDDVLSACYSFDTAEYCKFYFCPFCKETYCKFCYNRLKLDKSCIKCDPKNKKAIDQIKYLQSIIKDIKESLDIAEDDDNIPNDPPDVTKDGNTETKT